MDHVLIAQSPQSFCKTELHDFIAMVRAGGEVGGAVLQRNVENAQYLVFARCNSLLCGVAALKIPLPSHRQTIQCKSGVTLDISDFRFELGYIYVLPSSRAQGLSKKLTQEALSAAGDSGVFATVRTDNEPMRATLVKSGFVAVGTPYASERGQHQLQLFILSASIPKDQRNSSQHHRILG